MFDVEEETKVLEPKVARFISDRTDDVTAASHALWSNFAAAVWYSFSITLK